MKKTFLFIASVIIMSFSFQTKTQEQILLPVEELKLKNGLTVLLLKRDGAPVFSANIRIAVGSIDEPEGYTGIAHFFEHMAFKGTTKIGTKNYAEESKVLKKLHEVGTEIVQKKKAKAPKEEIEALEKKLHELEAEDDKFIEQNEFMRLFQRNGGGDINATTSSDYTNYFVSLPINKMELWAYLESSRLHDLVFREFYKERDVVFEERRMRYDNDPEGMLYEKLLYTAFDKNPYRHPVSGTAEDIPNYTFEAALNFYKTHYIPSRITIALVGNFDVAETKKIIEKYFGKLEAKKDENKIPDVNDLGTGYPRKQVLKAPYDPRLYIAFHRPKFPHADDEVLDVIHQILCEGRTSRMFTRLVKEKQIAADVDCGASLPGNRLDGLFTFYATPLSPHTNDEVEKEILSVLEEFKKNPVSKKELDKVKNQMDADLIWSLKSNKGLASLLTLYQSLAGDWKYLYTVQKRLEAITPEDVLKVANTYFVPGRQVTVTLEKTK